MLSVTPRGATRRITPYKVSVVLVDGTSQDTRKPGKEEGGGDSEVRVGAGPPPPDARDLGRPERPS